MTYKVEVIADNSAKWVGNGMTFDDPKDAEIYGMDLFNRWMAVRQWRVVTVPQDGGDVEVVYGSL